MVASTISNSGGPGSPTELSPVTIAVRDKVIEKFKDQPLKEMNESLKMLLANEQDEQKRLGILAGRVFILRQRIAALAETDQQRVVSTASPAPKDTEAPVQEVAEVGGDTTSEWTRLRILDDCEVNGVRFPKTVIIDVKSSDAQRLIDSGNAELVDEQPPGGAAPDAAQDDAPDAAQDTTDGTTADDSGDASAMQTELENAEAAVDEAVVEPGAEDNTGNEEADAASADTPAEDSPAEDAADVADEPSDDTAAMMETEEADAAEESPVETAQDTVIETPSAAEVTAALAALGSGNDSADEDTQTTDDNDDAGDGADLSADDEAAAVAAELEAAAGAMAAPPADPDTEDTDDSSKPGGWFEAQQNAEKAAKADADGDQEPAPEDEGPKDEK